MVRTVHKAVHLQAPLLVEKYKSLGIKLAYHLDQTEMSYLGDQGCLYHSMG